jgi:hypothetical protein
MKNKHQQSTDNRKLTAHNMNSNRKYIYRPFNDNNNQLSHMDNDDEQTDCESSEDMLERESGVDPNELVNDLRYYIEECGLTKEHRVCGDIINKLHDMGIIQ